MYLAPVESPASRLIRQETGVRSEARASETAAGALVAFGMCLITFALPLSAAYAPFVTGQIRSIAGST